MSIIGVEQKKAGFVLRFIDPCSWGSPCDKNEPCCSWGGPCNRPCPDDEGDENED